MPNEAEAIIAALGLQPHPEGGWYAETWRAPAAPGERAAGTAIYFLLKAGERSHWHRVDAAEVWLWHAGAALDLRMSATAQGPATLLRLGNDLRAGERPQVVVPAGFWQAAASTAASTGASTGASSGAFTLVSCVVAPGFSFAGFELAPPDFDIPDLRD